MLEIKEPTVNLGNIQFGKSYNFKYIITNKYNYNISINKIYVGCNSCTEALIDKKELAPDEEAEVNVKFTPGSTGMHNKKVFIAFSDDKFTLYPDLQLKFNAIVNE